MSSSSFSTTTATGHADYAGDDESLVLVDDGRDGWYPSSLSGNIATPITAFWRMFQGQKEGTGGSDHDHEIDNHEIDNFDDFDDHGDDDGIFRSNQSTLRWSLPPAHQTLLPVTVMMTLAPPSSSSPPLDHQTDDTVIVDNKDTTSAAALDQVVVTVTNTGVGGKGVMRCIMVLADEDGEEGHDHEGSGYDDVCSDSGVSSSSGASHPHEAAVSELLRSSEDANEEEGDEGWKGKGHDVCKEDGEKKDMDVSPSPHEGSIVFTCPVLDFG